MGRAKDEKIEAWVALLETQSRLSDGLNRELDVRVNLALPRYDVLFKLAEYGGTLRMSDLAEKILLSRSGLSRLVGRMESDGLVERQDHAFDGRGSSAVITTKGRHLLRKAVPIAHEFIVENFANYITRSEAQALNRILEKVLVEAREHRTSPATTGRDSHSRSETKAGKTAGSTARKALR